MTDPTTLLADASGPTADRLRRLPDRWSLASVRMHETRDGVATHAKVKLDGVVIGVLENDGHGGGTYLYPTAGTERPFGEVRDLFQAAAVAYAPDDSPGMAVERLADDLLLLADLDDVGPEERRLMLEQIDAMEALFAGRPVR